MATIVDAAAEFYEGVQRLERGAYEEAVASFSEAIRISPEFEPPYRFRALAYRALDRVADANTDLDSVMSITRAWLEEAQQARTDTDGPAKPTEEDREPKAEVAPYRGPDMAGIVDAATKFFDGVRRFDAREYERAVSLFSESITLAPTYEPPYRFRAQAYETLGRAQEANADLDAVIAIGQTRLDEAGLAHLGRTELPDPPEYGVGSTPETTGLDVSREGVRRGLRGQSASRALTRDGISSSRWNISLDRSGVAFPILGIVINWALAALGTVSLAAIASVVVWLVFAQGGAEPESEPRQPEVPIQGLALLEVPSATSTPMAELVAFVGRGDNLTSNVRLQEGLTVLNIQHNGTTAFVVELVGESGSSVLSVDTEGRYVGTRAHQVSAQHTRGLAPGLHRISITADGPWTIDVAQPVWDTASSPPVDWASKGDDIVGPIMLRAGVVPARFTHQGSSEFRVELVSLDGRISKSLVEGVGVYDGRVEVEISEGSGTGLPAGRYATVVRAGGKWTLSFGE